MSANENHGDKMELTEIEPLLERTSSGEGSSKNRDNQTTSSTSPPSTENRVEVFAIPLKIMRWLEKHCDLEQKQQLGQMKKSQVANYLKDSGNKQLVVLHWSRIDDSGSEVKMEEKTKGSVLHLAAAQGKHKIVRYLVEDMGLSVHDDTDSGTKPICLAVAHNHLTVVEFLLSVKATVDDVDAASRTFLHYAALSGTENTVNNALGILIKNIKVAELSKILLNQPENPLLLAIRYGLQDVVKSLLSYVDVEYRVDFKYLQNSFCFDKSSALHIACSQAHPRATDIVRQLLAVGASVCETNVEGKTPFMLAAEVGAVETITLLSQHNKSYYRGKLTTGDKIITNYDITTEKHYFPMPHIGDEKEKDTILKLSDFFAARIENGKSAWDYAIAWPTGDVCNALLEAACLSSDTAFSKGSSKEGPNCGSITCQAAAAFSSDDQYTWLQKLQYFVIVRNGECSTTPIHMAAEKGDIEKLEIFQSFGFPLERMLDSMGNTFLHAAAREGMIDVVRTYAKTPHYVNHTNKNGDSVLSVACSAGQYECIRHLLKNDDCRMLSLVNKQGRTALHELCARSDLPLDVLRDAVRRSAEFSWCGVPFILTQKDNNGRTALDVLAGNPNLLQRDFAFELFYPFKLNLMSENVDDIRGLCSPLQEALRNRCVDNALALIGTFGSWLDTKAKDVKGLTVMHLVVQECLPQLVMPLIQCGADLGDYDSEGNTPLHMLVTLACERPEKEKDYLELLKEMLDGAAIWHFKKDKKTVLKKGGTDYEHHLRSAVTYFLTAIYNNDEMNVLMWAAYKCVECKKLLKALLTVPAVFCRTSLDTRTPQESDTNFMYYDVTNIVPATMTLSSEACADGDSAKITLRTARTPEDVTTRRYSWECHTYPMAKGLYGFYKEQPINHHHRKNQTRWNKNSLADIIVGHRDHLRQDRQQLLEVSPISDIITNYSSPYKYVYAILMIVHVIYMALFSKQTLRITAAADLSCEYVVNDTISKSNLSGIHVLPAEHGPIYLLIWPSLIVLFDVLYCVFYFWLNGYKWPKFAQWSICRSMTAPFRHLNVTGVNAYWFSGIAFSWLVIAWYVLNVQGSCHQDYVLASAMITGWLYSINFTQCIPCVFLFPRTLQHIVLKDIFKFSFVFGSLIVGYACAFQVLAISISSLHQEFPSMEDTFFDVFNWFIGMGELYKVRQNELNSLGKNATVMKATFVSYILLLNIVLVNFLVAIMNDTYSNIRNDETLAWKISTLQRVLDIENHYPYVGKLMRRVRVTSSEGRENLLSSVMRKILCVDCVIVEDKKRFYLKLKRPRTVHSSSEEHLSQQVK